MRVGMLRHLERLFARIPAAIAVGLLGACDGRAAPSFAEPVHFLDGHQLAIVSYSPDGSAARVAFLPREVREENLKELTAAENATWQYDLMGVQMVTKVDPLADGSLFLEYPPRRRRGHGIPDGNTDRG